MYDLYLRFEPQNGMNEDILGNVHVKGLVSGISLMINDDL